MAENKQKNYVASHIKRIDGKYGEFYSAKFKLQDLMNLENNGWVSLIITKRKEESEKGATHTAYEDTYNPTTNSEEVEEIDTIINDDADLLEDVNLKNDYPIDEELPF
jgi:predicted DNA binding protein|tara:strand:+ start:1079 stop:1402 length:324 start_codon:yes stop_codon:yes gene_type:complete